MKVGIDLDGVCYRFHSSYRYMMVAYRNVEMPPADEWTTWDWPEKFTSQEDRDWIWSEGVRLGLFRYGHIVKGAIIGVRELAEHHELSVVTHRPRSAVRDTIAWLHYVNLPFSGIHILSNEEPKSEVPYDALVDDKPENIEDAVMHARRGILFDQPWNQDYRAVERARGWPDVVRRLT